MKLDLKFGVAKEGRVFVHEARGGHAAVFGVELDADTVPAGFEGGDHGGAGAAERVEDGVADEREHLDEARGKLEGKRGRVLFGRGAREVPELLEPAVELVLRDHAELALFFGGLAVAARLALHEDVFDVVLDDGVRLVGCAEGSGSTIGHPPKPLPIPSARTQAASDNPHSVSGRQEQVKR